MSALGRWENDSRIVRALADLESLLRIRYPQASFRTFAGDDLEGDYLEFTMDADTEEVLDVVMPRLLVFEVEQELPVYVVPVPPPERVATQLDTTPSSSPAASLATLLGA